MKKVIISISIILVIVLGIVLINKNINNQEKDGDEVVELTEKINININGVEFTATLEDNDTTREFIKMLPLEINMNELNGNEKYYYLNSNLPSDSKRIGTINSGDIMLYGENCLVIFYDTFNSSYSYTRIGKIDNPDNLNNVVGKGNIKVNIRK